jgi:hypothetical protein
VIAAPDPDAETMPPFLLEEDRVDLQDVLWEGALTARRGSLRRRLRALLSGTNERRVDAMPRIVQIAETHGRLLLVAVMRKLTDQPFRVPFQGLYAEAISAPQIRSAYRVPGTGV